MTTLVRTRTYWKFLMVGLLASFVVLSSAPIGISRIAHAGGDSPAFRFSRSERCLMRRINGARAAHGLHRLEADKQLAYVARQHAHSMASSGGVWHDSDVGSQVTRWRRLAQNTGRGGSCRSLARAFMQSSTHRHNILGRYRFIGVGVGNRSGRLYVQQLFESRANPGNIYHFP